MISQALIQDLLQKGWTAFKVRPWPIVLMMLGLGVVSIALQLFAAAIFGEKSWQSNSIGVVIQVLFMIFYPGLQSYMLKAVRHEVPKWSDFFWGWQCPVRIFSADILSTLPLMAASLLGGVALLLVNALAVPEALIFFKYITLGVLGSALAWVLVYFGIRLNQWSLLLIDRSVTATQSVRQSWTLMRGHSLTFFALLIIVALMNCLGALALVIGIFVTFPVSLGTFAAFYVRISRENSPTQLS